MNKRSSGFTLIELMIVVVVIGILAAVAYPSYVEQVRASKRADATAALMALAQSLERNYTLTGHYKQWSDGTAIADVAAILGTNTVPLDGGATSHTLTAPIWNQTQYRLTATAVDDPNCNTLNLNQDGSRTSANSGGTATTDCW